MADTYGAIAIPITVPPEGVAVGDPLLTYVGSYLQAVLNAYITTAWQSVAPTIPVVRTVYTSNPSDVEWNESDLPAIYLWRQQGGEEEHSAEDWYRSHDTLTFLWVPPPTPQATAGARGSIFNAIVKVIGLAIERNRDPSWVVASDVDPTAATLGSVLSTWAGWEELRRGAWRANELVIDVDASQAHYPMLEIDLPVVERVAFGLDSYEAPPVVEQTIRDQSDATTVESETFN